MIGSGTVGTGCLLELRAVATAAGNEPPPWLASADIVELEVDGLGILRNTVVWRRSGGRGSRRDHGVAGPQGFGRGRRRTPPGRR